MQHIPIKEELKDDKKIFLVNAIPLKNKNKSVVQKIPHPAGTDFIEYDTLEEAQDAITRAGFSYVLPNGQKGQSDIAKNRNKTVISYKDLIYETIKKKVQSQNSNVCAAAIVALTEFPTKETFDILFQKLGDDNDLIRKNAISGICRYAKRVQDKIISSLNHENWIVRNSTITCISQLINDENIEIEKFIEPLVKTCQDGNPIVESNALNTLALVYQNYQKRQNNI